MKSEHRPLAEADQSQLAVVEAVTIEFGIQKSIERRARLVDAGPAFARVAHRQTEPLASARDLAAGFRRVRRDKGSAGQQISPLLADRDQIVAVGAISVQKDDELIRPLRFCRKARSVERCRHNLISAGVWSFVEESRLYAKVKT